MVFPIDQIRGPEAYVANCTGAFGGRPLSRWGDDEGETTMEARTSAGTVEARCQAPA